MRRSRGNQRPRKGRGFQVLVLLLLAGAGWAAWTAMARSPSGRMEVVVAPKALTMLLGGVRRDLLQGDEVPVDGVILTGQAEMSALRYAGSTFRMGSGTKLRLVHATPLQLVGITVSLERGRLWVSRDATTPVTVRIPGGQVSLRPGDTEVRVALDGSATEVAGWSAGAEVQSREGRLLFPLEAGQVAFQDAGGGWKLGPLLDAVEGTDSWVRWNRSHGDLQLRTGQAEEYRPKETPSKERETPIEVRAASRARAVTVRLPALPGRDYPLYVPRGGSVAVAPPPEQPFEDAEVASIGAVPDAPPPEVVPDVPRPAAATKAYQLPGGLTTRGRDAVSAAAANLSPRRVQNQRDADPLIEEVVRRLTGRFEMTLEKPFRGIAARPGDPTIQVQGHVSTVMALEPTANEWVGRVTTGTSEEEFAAWMAELYAEAWLHEQDVDPQRITAQGFSRWISFKYCVSAGYDAQAYSISGQGTSSAWVDKTPHEGFLQLWSIEEKRGEAGVFRAVLGL